MKLSNKTIKFLIDYLAGIKNISPGYESSKNVIKDLEDNFVFLKNIPDEFTYTVEEALEEGLNLLNENGFILNYLNSRLDKRYFLAKNNTNIQKATSLLGEILEPEGYSIVLNDNNIYTIVKTSKSTSKRNYTDALWALADDLRDLKDKGKFSTYEEAYRHGEKNFTHHGEPIKARSLRNEWHKASSAGRV